VDEVVGSGIWIEIVTPLDERREGRWCSAAALLPCCTSKRGPQLPSLNHSFESLHFIYPV
jgi:hypothetical protein